MTVLAGPSLRPPRDGDGEGRFALGNDPDIMRMFGADPKTVPPLTLDAAHHWITRLVAHPHAWVVEQEGRFLGEVRFDDVDRVARRARLAIGFYDAGKLGRGLGREAVRLALDHAFGPLGLERLTLRVLACKNGRSAATPPAASGKCAANRRPCISTDAGTTT
jgi:RimJ/RimL family protein N-acetyltransferase